MRWEDRLAQIDEWHAEAAKVLVDRKQFRRSRRHAEVLAGRDRDWKGLPSRVSLTLRRVGFTRPDHAYNIGKEYLTACVENFGNTSWKQLAEFVELGIRTPGTMGSAKTRWIVRRFKQLLRENHRAPLKQTASEINLSSERVRQYLLKHERATGEVLIKSRRKEQGLEEFAWTPQDAGVAL